MKRVYYQLQLTQLAPMRISGGNIYEQGTTDMDILLDGRGLPYIPGSALAGVLRSLMSKKDAETAFGYVQQNEGKIQASRVIVSDAVLKERKGVRKTIRDGVRLLDDGTAADKAKYDYEVVETRAPYTAILETEDDETVKIMRRLLSGITRQGISVGGRTSRGFGELVVSVREKSFDLPAQIQDWVDWDPYGDGAFSEKDAFVPEEETDAKDNKVCIEAELEVVGSLMIRVPLEGDEANAVGLRNMAGKAVIPGTTWAGALRHHMRQLARTIGSTELGEQINLLFGIENEKEQKYVKSKLTVSETVLEGSRETTYTRNALDRFTMAPRNSALFTEKIIHGGHGAFRLRASDMDQTVFSLLMASLQDLHDGLATVGGEGSVGRGCIRFTRMTVNGKDLTGPLNRFELVSGAEEVCAHG